MKYIYIIVIGISVLMISCQRQNIVENQNWQWRGENRDGVYHNEKGLLKEWPVEGAELLWYYEGLGEGYSSATIGNGKLYITGINEDDLVLFEFDLSGKLLRKKIVGKEWSDSYPGPRSTISVNDGKLYIFNALGTLFCLDEETLNEVWNKDLFSEFDDTNTDLGVNESPLIVGDKVFMTPGGETYNMVALDKNTGDLIWSSPGERKRSTYCSPQYIGDQSVPIVITNTAEFIVAFNADTGEKLWSFPQTNPPFENHPNTPIYSDGKIFSITGYAGGSMLLQLKDGGRAVELIWKNDVDNQMGGAVKVGDYVYASGHRKRGWHCIDWKTGEITYSSNELSNGTIIYADGMLYIYSDKGEVALVKPNPEKFDLVSAFSVQLGTGAHWAHPVIHNGVLYIRHGDALMAYKVK